MPDIQFLFRGIFCSALCLSLQLARYSDIVISAAGFWWPEEATYISPRVKRVNVSICSTGRARCSRDRGVLGVMK